MNEEKMDELLRLMRSVVPDTSDMSDAGRVGFVYRHNYDPTVQYEELDVVKFGMSLWTPKAATIGNPPPDQSQEGQELVEENDYWVMFLPGALGSDYVKKTDIARAPSDVEEGTLGISMPDGKTITIDENGIIKGAPSGKQLTREEMDAQIASGELGDGDVVYLTGPAAGENGLLVKVDKELNAESVNPVQNKIITEALNRLDSLIEETKALRATLETYGLVRISESETVTEADSGLVLSAREKNSSIEGTIGNEIKKIEQLIANTGMKNILHFNNVDLFSSVSNSCIFVYENNCSNIPMRDRGGIGICLYLNNSWISLIVVPYSYTGIYVASKADSTWSGWAGPK